RMRVISSGVARPGPRPRAAARSAHRRRRRTLCWCRYPVSHPIHDVELGSPRGEPEPTRRAGFVTASMADLVHPGLIMATDGEAWMKAYDFKVLLEPDETGGYVATCPSLPGCYSQGETVDGALDNIREAIELCLEDVW